MMFANVIFDISDANGAPSLKCGLLNGMSCSYKDSNGCDCRNCIIPMLYPEKARAFIDGRLEQMREVRK